MVQQYKTKSQFDIPYSLLCPVYFYRYPNPLATHVLSVDVIAREIVVRPVVSNSGESSDSSHKTRQVQQQYVLKTTRLILKKGTLPRWAPKGLIRNAESWVLEESEIDLDGLTPESIEARGGGGKGREMRAWTRNLDHTTVMAVTESNVFREKLNTQINEKNEKGDRSVGSAGLKSLYDVTSGVSFGLLRSRIEKFGLHRVITHVDTSRQGILSTYQRLIEERSGDGVLLSAAGKAIDVPSEKIGEVQQVASKRARLLAALRPPFLDGDFVGPIARTKRRLLAMREWWRTLDRGGTGDETNFRVVRSSSQKELQEQDEEYLTPMERLRKRLLKLREQSKTAFNKGQDFDENDDDEF